MFLTNINYWLKVLLFIEKIFLFRVLNISKMLENQKLKILELKLNQILSIIPNYLS